MHTRALHGQTGLIGWHTTVNSRGLSAAQQGVLLRYLEGMNNKEIAAASGCTESTIYEHWRRMARKANTRY